MYQAAGETNIFQKKDAEESRPAWIEHHNNVDNDDILHCGSGLESSGRVY